MKTVIVLGAGGGQVPLMQVGKRRGYRVVAVGNEASATALSVADRVILADVRDSEHMRRIAEEESVCGILTDQADAAVFSAAYVAEALGLPGIGVECAVRFADKSVMRKAVPPAVDQPRYAAVTDETGARIAADGIGYPCVVKPADNDGSRGVTLVRRGADVSAAFTHAAAYSQGKTVLIEEYLTGDLYEIQGYTQDGLYTPLCVSRETLFAADGVFVPNTNIYVSAASSMDAIERRIAQTDRLVVEGLGLPFGASQSEYLHDPVTDRLYLIETAARGGGAFISSDVVRHACGADLPELLLNGATDPAAHAEIALREGAAGYVCFALEAGVITRVEGLEELPLIDGVVGVYADGIAVGTTTKPLRDKRGRYGPILVAGGDRARCRQVIDRVRQTLHIWVDTGKGVRDIIW